MYHMVMHHVNAYEDEQNGEVVFQVSAQDDCDKLFSGPTGAHAHIPSMLDEHARDKTMPWGKLREFQLKLNTPEPQLSHSDIVLRDSEGFVYGMDFPFVNPTVAAKYNRYIWGLSAYARNSTHYADWAVLKIDRESRGSYNTKVWYRMNHFPSEPVFVPRPGATAEDDGVLLVQVLDGIRQLGYLLILDAQSMSEVATSSLQDGEHVPYSQHGRWFEQDPSFMLAI